MSLPYFPLYPSDFEAKTSHLTLEEDGAYNRLLRLCWMTPGCSLPDDPAWIARRMRVDAETYERVVAPLLAEFFHRGGGRIDSPKLTCIFMETDEKHTRRVEAGKKGGRPPKSLKRNTTEQSNVKAMPKQPEPEPDKKEEIGKPISPSNVVSASFEAFWAEVPRRVGKAEAIKAYAKALTKTDAATLLSAIRAYAEARRGEDEQYTAHPSSWLNAERWTDEITKNGGRQVGKPDRLDAMLRGAATPFVDRGSGCDTSQPLLAVRRSAGNH